MKQDIERKNHRNQLNENFYEQALLAYESPSLVYERVSIEKNHKTHKKIKI